MYALLCNYASDSDRCWPSQATLAARLSCSVSSVKKYMTELVGINLIQVRREHYRSSVYYLLQPAALKSASQEAKPGCRQPDSACPEPKVGYINTLNKQREIQNPPLPPVPSALPGVAASPRPAVLGGVSVSDFEKAWELYPKKESKGLARSAWLRLQREGLLPPLPRIEATIRHFMASEAWQREQGRFVPQMSNWLKGQRWLDDAVMTAAKEAETRECSAAALQVMQQKEEARRAAMDKEREALRPRFEAFAEKFHLHATPWIRPMAFGLWMHLHSAHRAPTPADTRRQPAWHCRVSASLQAALRRSGMAKTCRAGTHGTDRVGIVHLATRQQAHRLRCALCRITQCFHDSLCLRPWTEPCDDCKPRRFQ